MSDFEFHLEFPEPAGGTEEMFRVEEHIMKDILEQESYDSGFGFGIRDIDAEVEDISEADALDLAKRIKMYLKNNGFDVDSESSTVRVWYRCTDWRMV